MIDILGREEFTQRIFDMMVRASEKGQSLSFAIDGEWGVGKSFVLDLLCDRLKQQQSEAAKTDRFIVFRYNTWEYDYYEEPIIAIVASMQDELAKNNFAKIMNKAKDNVTQVAVSNFQTFAQTIVKNKMGIDISGLFDGSQKDKEIDSFSPLRAAIEELRKHLSEMAQNTTVVIVIDELDRCIPEYVIKVLNRCNHLFDGIDNMQLVFTINNKQIEHSVATIFGESIEYKKYIKKFINNMFMLDSGVVGNEIIEKYAEYFGNFEQSDDKEIQSYIVPFINSFGISIRDQERIMERISLAHYSVITEIKDPAVLLFEIVVAFCTNENKRECEDIFVFTEDNKLDILFEIDCDAEGIDELTDKWRYIGINQYTPNSFYGKLYYEILDNSMGRMLFVLEQLFGDKTSLFVTNKDYSELVNACKRFWKLYNISE